MNNNYQFLEKPLPSSGDAERAVIGAILLDNALIAQAVERLRAEDFYSPTHRWVFEAMVSLFKKSRRIDPITIGEEINLSGKPIESLGGIATITNLTFGIPHFDDISEYCRIVADKSKIRALVQTCSEISSTALEDSDTAERILDFAQSKINEICAETGKSGFATAGETAIKSLQDKLELRKSDVNFTGFQTGFKVIDDATGGLQKGELIILGARPGIGKSSLMVNIADYGCELQPGSVIGIFSLEMTKAGLIERMMCSRSRVNATRYRKALFSDSEAERLSAATAIISGYNLEIDDTPGLSPAQVRAKSMWLLAKYKRLDLIIVDFLQKMSPSRRAESHRLEVGQIACELKDMAKALEVPVLAISRLSRECEARADKKPIMSDLAESNIIESEADIIAFLFRENYYRKEANPFHAELIFAKNRNGEEGTFELQWIGEYTRFENA